MPGFVMGSFLFDQGTYVVEGRYASPYTWLLAFDPWYRGEWGRRSWYSFSAPLLLAWEGSPEKQISSLLGDPLLLTQSGKPVEAKTKRCLMLIRDDQIQRAWAFVCEPPDGLHLLHQLWVSLVSAEQHVLMDVRARLPDPPCIGVQARREWSDRYKWSCLSGMGPWSSDHVAHALRPEWCAPGIETKGDLSGGLPWHPVLGLVEPDGDFYRPWAPLWMTQTFHPCTFPNTRIPYSVGNKWVTTRGYRISPEELNMPTWLQAGNRYAQVHAESHGQLEGQHAVVAYIEVGKMMRREHSTYISSDEFQREFL